MLSSLRDFWRRHKRKVIVSTGVLGSGYVLYRLYNAHRRRLDDLERELATERKRVDEFVKDQMQAHFENIQRIADTTTLPHAMQFLSSRIEEELQLSHLTDRLMQGKGQPNTLTYSEKLELWDKLKYLSFTRMVLSLWTMTLLSLYIRVQVNILGRHLYIDTARHIGSSHFLDDGDLIDRDDQQKFLASADFLSTNGLPALISNMQAAVTEVIKGKQLRDFFNAAVLHETIVQILDTFKSIRSPHLWVDFLMPANAHLQELNASSSGDNTVFPDVSKFDLLMLETRAVLSSVKFTNVAEVALKAVVDALIEEIGVQCGEDNLATGMPLARLLARVTHVGPILLDEPSKNKFIEAIQNVPEVEMLFTVLYANADVLD
ncbi:peroxisome biogenesis protein 3-2 [Humulus lupulus]|uniref:peroxisome biogenesis protein 3-2 n=1 Tax=Humulus lupulus TaxID=3486 RepID=UPI002B408E4F|nr:peroxisome biogenesis protein 3-2 [Humulus lupulus]